MFDRDAQFYALLARRKNENGLTYAIEVGDYFRNLEGEVTEWLFGATPPEVKQGLPKFKTPRFTRTVANG
jgi:hypothetical protein